MTASFNLLFTSLTDSHLTIWCYVTYLQSIIRWTKKVSFLQQNSEATLTVMLLRSYCTGPICYPSVSVYRNMFSYSIPITKCMFFYFNVISMEGWWKYVFKLISVFYKIQNWFYSDLMCSQYWYIFVIIIVEWPGFHCVLGFYVIQWCCFSCRGYIASNQIKTWTWILSRWGFWRRWSVLAITWQDWGKPHETHITIKI